MQPIDLVVYAAIAAVALYPFAGQALRLLDPMLSLVRKPAEVKEQEWRQRWSATVIDFIDEVEGGEAVIKEPDAALRLARELVWEIIGGEQRPAKTK